MTRDGTFRIEGGKVTGPWSTCASRRRSRPSSRLSLGFGTVRLVNQSDFYGERYPFGALVPAIATEAFTVVGSGSGPGL